MRVSNRIGVVVAVLLTLTSCSARSTQDGSFGLHEFSIDGPKNLSVETEAVTVVNEGRYPHTLVVTDSNGEVVAATPLVQPGETTELDLDLEAGRYSFTCRIVAQDPDGNIVDHYESGMNATVSATG